LHRAPCRYLPMSHDTGRHPLLHAPIRQQTTVNTQLMTVFLGSVNSSSPRSTAPSASNAAANRDSHRFYPFHFFTHLDITSSLLIKSNCFSTDCYIVELVLKLLCRSLSSNQLRHLMFIVYLGGGGQDSAVGIATRYGLGGSGIESRWGARFSTSVQIGTGAHPASYAMDNGSFPGVKAAGVWR
jgi:hypothetical protein